MFLNEIKIENYKCFKNNVSLKLEQGINVIVGKNNVGKTALLEALSLQFPDRPHYSVETYPKANRRPHGLSKVNVTFTIEKDELIDLILIAKSKGNADFNLPLGKKIISSLKLITNDDKSDDFQKALENSRAKTFAQEFFNYETYTFKLQREAYSDDGGNWYALDDTYVHPQFDRAETNEGKTQYYINFQVESSDRSFDFKEKRPISGGNGKHREDFSIRVAYELYRYIYKFRAERIPSDACKLGQNSKLNADSRNLAEVLNLLQGHLTQFNKLNRLVKQILPSIFQIGVLPYEQDNTKFGQVVIWNTKDATEYKHLARTLDDVGSGVGQVISILYVLLTATSPQVILIDEPQSFLHPDASRKLVELLQYYADKYQHQIIIATHSPIVITSADPTTVTLAKQKGSKSILQKVDIHKVESQRIYLGEIGARLSDVFGYDRVIWVEGLTEEICFPKIVRKLSTKPLLGTAILQVYATGDVDNKDEKDVDRIFHIYETLSLNQEGLVPEAVGYIFDREDRSQEKVDEKEDKYLNMYFTPKRLYENYLLNPDAIAFVISQIKKGTKIDSSNIKSWIEKQKTDKYYYQPFDVPNDLDTWTQTIHGKRLLKNLFKKFSNAKFKEKIHSVLLTEWILENSDKDLLEIAKLIEKVVKSKKSTI